MEVAGLNLYRYSLPLTEPLTLGGATLHRREGLLLELFSESGASGWGEAAPLPGFSRESLDKVEDQLREMDAMLVSRSVDELQSMLDTAEIAPSTRFGLELAVLNLRAAVEGSSLPELLSPEPRRKVVLNALLDGPPEDVLGRARELRGEGYRTVKLKVGRRPVEEDAGLLRALSRELGGVALRLDANRAWSFSEAEEFARCVEGVELEYVEEPLADPVELPRLAGATGLPVALDESLVGMEPEELEEYHYARAAVLKPTLLGGLSQTLELAGRARELGLTPVASSAYESGIGTLGLLALAAAIGESPAGLDTYRRLAADLLEPPLALGVVVDVEETLGAPRGLDRRFLEEVRA